MDKNIYTLLLQSILRHLFYNIFLCFLTIYVHNVTTQHPYGHE